MTRILNINKLIITNSNELVKLLLQHTAPNPVFLAFAIANPIQKTPTTVPSTFLPSTYALEHVSLHTAGASFAFIFPVRRLLQYQAKK